MVIIIGADDIDFNDLKQTIYDIFAAGTNSDQRAALTLVYSSPEEDPGLQSEIWFVFEPYNILTERAFVDFVWSRLESDEQDLIKNPNELEKLLIESHGSTSIVRGIWDKYVTNLRPKLAEDYLHRRVR